ncbi:hypothetical protein I4U23_020012 [Adineta vaga]|nr:hypothetical protein I4U23_020012 [Adineta vaga]
MLNKALRTHDIEVISKFGFFIKDLHYQLKDLRQNLLSSQFTVYRGQSMSSEEYEKLKENLSGLISFNSFLSTTADQHISLVFALSSLDAPNVKAILFVINVDLTLTSNPIGYLDERLSCFHGEQEYLWDMNTVFRISDIQELENDVCQVNLTMTDSADLQLKQLTEYMRKEVGILSGKHRLGNLMIAMGEWNKAKDIYEVLLQEEEDPYIIQQLGFIAHKMNNLDIALQYYRDALSLFTTLLSPNDSGLATIHSNIDCVLSEKEYLDEALKQFERSLELQRRARTYNNIATIYEKQECRKEALENMGHSLRMLRESLPPTHPEIAISLSNIGTLYDKNKQYSKALSYYDRSLSIQKVSLPEHHPDIIHTSDLMKQTLERIKLQSNTLNSVSYFESHCKKSLIHGGLENYTGLPVAASFDAIILFPRKWFGTDMPNTGQQAILDAQKTGTGIVLTEWANWRVHQQNQWHILSDLCLKVIFYQYDIEGEGEGEGKGVGVGEENINRPTPTLITSLRRLYLIDIKPHEFDKLLRNHVIKHLHTLLVDVSGSGSLNWSQGKGVHLIKVCSRIPLLKICRLPLNYDVLNINQIENSSLKYETILPKLLNTNHLRTLTIGIHTSHFLERLLLCIPCIENLSFGVKDFDPDEFNGHDKVLLSTTIDVHRLPYLSRLSINCRNSMSFYRMITLLSSVFGQLCRLSLELVAFTSLTDLLIISGDIIQQICIDRLQSTATYTLNLLLYAADDFEENIIYNSFFKVQFIHRKRPRVFIQKFDVRDVGPRYYCFSVYTLPYKSTTLSSYIFSADLEKSCQMLINSENLFPRAETIFLQGHKKVNSLRNLGSCRSSLSSLVPWSLLTNIEINHSNVLTSSILESKLRMANNVHTLELFDDCGILLQSILRNHNLTSLINQQIKSFKIFDISLTLKNAQRICTLLSKQLPKLKKLSFGICDGYGRWEKQIYKTVNVLICISNASPCSDLDLSTSNKNIDENYSIHIETFRSSNIIKVILIRKQILSDTSWFLMGASNTSKLIGLWQPFTPLDGQVTDCSTNLEQAVTNKDSFMQSTNQLRYTFYWMHSNSLNQSIIFVATIFYSNEKSTIRYIQSLPIEIEHKQGRERYQDTMNFCDSSPCQNGGLCIRDAQYSFCRCIAPWNGIFCHLQYFHIMLASTQPFTAEFYFNTLNSASYANLTTSLTAWLNTAFDTLPSNRIYSLNSVSPSPIGTYLSISLALTPRSGSYASVILLALRTALARNGTTSFGHQLSIDPTYISNAVTQDGTPYTSCIFPFTFNLIDYNFCIPYQSKFICSSARVIDRNTTLSSLDCSRNIFHYITRDICFPNICLNDGTCVNVNGIATCNCPAYFTGSRCDQLYGCNPITNSQAITCVNYGTCVVAGITGCNFPFTYMGVTYSTCAVINNQSLCVAKTYASNGQFPVSLVSCGAPQCENNPCGNRGTCQDTVRGSFRCINCTSGYYGYFCEIQYRTVPLKFNMTYVPDYQNLSHNATKQLQRVISQTLNTAFMNITNGGVISDLIQIIRNPDGTTGAMINISTNYLNFLNNSIQNALDRIGILPTVFARECTPWYIYQGQNVTGCVINLENLPICSLTNNYDRDGQFISCLEPINLNLCNRIYCGDGRCVATSRNLTFCVCSRGITGTNCDQLLQCSAINCLNNGICVPLSKDYFRCNCAPSYGGIYCQYTTIGCVFPFVDNQNRTQNTCITTNDYMNGAIPWCRNAQGSLRSCQIDYCAQKPCKYGVCVPFTRWTSNGTSYPSFICNCTNGYTGQLCTHAYFRVKSLFHASNMSTTVLNALESPTTQTYQDLSYMFRDLIRNRLNSSYDFLPLIFTTYRSYGENFVQMTADMSFQGNISRTVVMNLIRPILAYLPAQFNLKFDSSSLVDIDDIQPLNPSSNCTFPYEYNGQLLSVCHLDSNGIAYCAYGQNYTLIDRKLCDTNGLPTVQYTACDLLNVTNPCNSTLNFPIKCVASDTSWTCFCELTQTLGRDCRFRDVCQTNSPLCRNNGSCVSRPDDIEDFMCKCTVLYHGRLCENFNPTNRFYTIYLMNYSNETSPVNPILISSMNQTIINITNGNVIANSITVSCAFPFTYNGVNYTTCTTTGFGFPWCSTTPTYTGLTVDCRNGI